MKVSTKGRYALRLLVDIAVNGDGNEFVPLRDVAHRQEISVKYLEQIVSTLCRAGMLASQRGPTGGYRLQSHAGQCTVAQILEIAEGSLAPVACAAEDGSCHRESVCSTLWLWQGLYDTVMEYLGGITLGDLVAREQARIAKDGPAVCVQ